MGKILVKGKSERQYEADTCIIDLIITTDCSDSSAATKEADKIMEELLQAMEQIGIEAECFRITEDKTAIESHYNDVKGYTSTRHLELRVTRSMALVNDIREVIGNGFPKVALYVSYAIANEGEYRKELLKEAIHDSRERADMMAAAVGCKIIGLETARLSDGYFDIDDIEDLTENEREHVYLCQESARGVGRLADRLQTEKVELKAEVSIVWLTE